VQHVRGFVRSTLATVCVGADVSYAAQLVASELVTNVVRHNAVAFDPVATILLSRAGTKLRVAIHDCDPIGGELSAPDEDSESGRGLLVVAGIADQWGVNRTAVGKSTWCEFAAWPDETIADGA
jgi:anti-sigma regulatory factor (Ser/Thr protein kinase)